MNCRLQRKLNIKYISIIFHSVIALGGKHHCVNVITKLTLSATLYILDYKTFSPWNNPCYNLRFTYTIISVQDSQDVCQMIAVHILYRMLWVVIYTHSSKYSRRHLFWGHIIYLVTLIKNLSHYTYSCN